MKTFTLFEYSSSAKRVNIVFLGLLNHHTEKKKKENKYIISVLEELYVLTNLENMYHPAFLLMTVKYGS